MINETYNDELNPLIRYINGGIDPYDFMHLFTDWLEESGQDPEDWGIEGDDEWEQRDNVTDDPDRIIDQMDDGQRQSFIRFIEHHAHAYDMDAMMPIYMHAYGAKLVKRPTFLVHFSDDADDIADNGFKFGTDDPWHSGLTTHFTDAVRKKAPGWNFAFVARSGDDGRAARAGKYGRHAVLFQSAGVEFAHSGDMEHQVLFYGPGVKQFILITNDDGEWVIEDSKTYRELFRGDYADAVDWAMENVRQYSRRIVSNV